MMTITIFSPSYTLDHSADSYLFPVSDVQNQGYLSGPLHTIWFMEYGNPKGIPIVAVHGGPGGGTNARDYRLFDPTLYRIIVFDQRGSGRSLPGAETKENNTQCLIDDMESLREHLAIPQWVLCGGSWGSALSLAYGQAHPGKCLGFILRGIFLATKNEWEQLWQGMGDVYPEAFHEYSHYVPEVERHDLCSAFYERLVNVDPAIHMPAALAFYKYDMTCATLVDKKALEGPLDMHRVLALSRLFAHYCKHDFFLKKDQLMENLARVTHLPLHIVHGRYDIICRANSAYKLHKAWPNSTLTIVPDAGHSSLEPGITRALIEATNRMADTKKFSIR